MMNRTTGIGRGGVALGALILAGMIAPPAFAQDANWTWTRDQTDLSSSTINRTLDVLPTGDAAISARQIYLGDVTSSADANASVLPATTPLDGSADLGHVDASAASYANMYQGQSEVPLSVNMGQYHLGLADVTSTASPTVADPTALNQDRAFANALIADSASGLFTPHDTTASATAMGIEGATASADARASSNIASFEVAALPAELDAASGLYLSNALLGADLTQLSIGGTGATATTGVSLADMSNMGGLDRPVAAASATATGNLGTAMVRFGTLDLGL